MPRGSIMVLNQSPKSGFSCARSGRKIEGDS